MALEKTIFKYFKQYSGILYRGLDELHKAVRNGISITITDHEG